MRRRITYGMEEMFVGSTGGFSEAKNTGQYVSRLDFVQSYDFSFSVQRQPNKQLGSDFYALRVSQLAPDVNLNLSYLLNDGWNEKYIGLDIPTNGTYSNPIQSIFANQSTGDRNFYVLIAAEEHSEAAAATSVEGYNVLGIGNAFITSYDINLSVNGLANVTCSFVGANANVNNYSSSSNWLPSVGHTGQTAESESKKFGFNFLDNSRSSRFLTGFAAVFDSGCHYGASTVSASPIAVSGLKLGFDFNNFQSLHIHLPFERKALYGFGNNYPYARNIQKPAIGTISLDSIVSGFSPENLATTFASEDVTMSGYNFDIMFKNSRGKQKLGVKIQNARLDSYNIATQIGGTTIIKTNWSFEINNSTGILMSGSCGTPTPSAIYINESINP